MRRVRWVWLAAVGAGVASAACSAILDLEPPPGPDGGSAGTDAGDATVPGDAAVDAADAPAPDALGDAPSAVCMPLDAGTVTYNPLGQVVLDDAGTHTWDFYSPTPVTSGAATSYGGGAFDGRYVYFAGRGVWVTRYDTTAGPGAFDGGPAWSAEKVTTLGVPGSIPGGFLGAVYDGRYVYFVPYEVGTNLVSVAARFDTAGAFDAESSWSSFDLATLSAEGGAPTRGFTGGVFDGRYVYFVPRTNGVPDGRVVRYDTELPDAGSVDAGSIDAGSIDAGDAAPRDSGPVDGALADGAASDAGPTDAGPSDAGATDAADAAVAVPAGFASPAQWSTFDVASVNPAAIGFAGGVFDGKSVYLAPAINDVLDAAVNGGQSSIVARYTADAGFTAAASWSTFDLTRLSGQAFNTFGGAFDGRYVYFSPRETGIVTQLDTQGSFESVASWATFDLTRVIQREGGASPTFTGAAFDGRFVYFVPTVSGFATVARYDTLSPFGADCAWSTVDLTQVDPVDGAGLDFAGAVFDGTYLYLIPFSGGLPVARFFARSPGATPPPFQGSFL